MTYHEYNSSLMADLITHLLTISKLDKSDKMDCSFWSTFGVPPHPAAMVHTMSSHHDKGEHEERHKTSEQLTPDLIILHFPFLPWGWAGQQLLALWDKHSQQSSLVDVFMDCSCVEASPTHNSCLLHGRYMFQTPLTISNQYREGEWWVTLLASPLKAVWTLLP